MLNSPNNPPSNAPVRGKYWKLALAVLILACLWLGVLPRLSHWEYVQRRLDGYRRAEIDPNAFFYTDHPGMRDIERRIDSVVNGSDRTFWKIPAPNSSR